MSPSTESKTGEEPRTSEAVARRRRTHRSAAGSEEAAPEPRARARRESHPGRRAGAPDARRPASRGRVDAERDPGQFGRRLWRPLRLGPTLHLEDADHGRSDPEQPRAALLRGARREGPDDPERQRTRVLRPARTSTPTNSSCSSRRSNTARRRSEGPSPTASSSFHRTVLEEHLRIKGRTPWYETVMEMQKDLDAYLETTTARGPTVAPA